MGSIYPLTYYTLACKETFFARNALLGTISLMACIVTFAMMSDFFQHPGTKPHRAALFVAFGLFVTLPLNTSWFGDEQNTVQYDPILFILGGLAYIFGAFLFAMRFPESCKPGQYDCCGQSHNIFHLLVLVGAGLHFYASLNLY